MKLNNLFGLLVVALCATTQLDAGAGRAAAARRSVRTAPVQQAQAPATTVVPAQTTSISSDDPKVALVQKTFGNLIRAALQDPTVAAAVQAELNDPNGITATIGADRSAVLGRLGANPEYDECCKKCANKHKAKKAAKPAKKQHEKTKKANADKHHDKEHAKKK